MASGLCEGLEAEAERRMEAGRLLLRSLPSAVPALRITEIYTLYRRNTLFLPRHGEHIAPEARRRFLRTQESLARAARDEKPHRRADHARKIAIRAWRSVLHAGPAAAQNGDPAD